jgi:N-[(2S)-2-amino-2-carboxyethyl]-L-glutamate dehydrogenase
LSEFYIVPGSAIGDILADCRDRVLDIVREVYLLHHQGRTVNPNSYFLRFPDRPRDRVIALPAYVDGTINKIGIKWIASFPGNLGTGLDRASAVIVLNDSETGYPVACLEGAQISAHRTAASAALAAKLLSGDAQQASQQGGAQGGAQAGRLAFVGGGVIARNILEYLLAVDFPMTEITCFDVTADRARSFMEQAAVLTGVPVRQAECVAQAVECDTVVFATTSAAPHVDLNTPLRPGQLLLHISLRDLAPELLLNAYNIVDDVDHCLRAGTSPHLAEQLTGTRDFVTGTLGGILAGEVRLAADRPVIFSPFGLGSLDLAVGSFVLDAANRRGTAMAIPGFFR